MKRKKGKLYKLLARILSGKAGAAEQAMANAWYKQLDLHKAEAFKDGEAEKQMQKAIGEHLYQHVHGRPEAGHSIGWGKIRWAAAVLLITGAAFLLNDWGHKETMEGGSESAGAGIRHVQLPDGTKVVLNGGAVLSWGADFNQEKRVLQLTGEAFFDVKADRGRPFILQTGKLQTKVLGTSFNVEAYSKESQIRVALLQGKVDVSAGTGHVRLVPGQLAEYSLQDNELRVKTTAVDHPEGWVNGGLVFNDIPLQAALDRFAGFYGLVLAYDRQQAQGKTVTASFGKVPWPEALNSMLFMFNMQYTDQDGKILITTK